MGELSLVVECPNLSILSRHTMVPSAVPVHVYITVAEDEAFTIIDALNDAALSASQDGAYDLCKSYRQLRDRLKERLKIGRQA